MKITHRQALKLDKFYLNPDIVDKCLETIDLDIYDFIVEPSAGNGRFYNKINHHNKVGIDIEPECDNIIKQNFLNWKPNFTYTKVLTIGGPPFGGTIRTGYPLATKFLNHAATYSDTIAFVLPKRYDIELKNFNCNKMFDISKSSFTFNGEHIWKVFGYGVQGTECSWNIYTLKNNLTNIYSYG